MSVCAAGPETACEKPRKARAPSSCPKVRDAACAAVATAQPRAERSTTRSRGSRSQTQPAGAEHAAYTREKPYDISSPYCVSSRPRSTFISSRAVPRGGKRTRYDGSQRAHWLITYRSSSKPSTTGPCVGEDGRGATSGGGGGMGGAPLHSGGAVTRRGGRTRAARGAGEPATSAPAPRRRQRCIRVGIPTGVYFIRYFGAPRSWQAIAPGPVTQLRILRSHL